jgi:hypothetical protein
MLPTTSVGPGDLTSAARESVTATTTGQRRDLRLEAVAIRGAAWRELRALVADSRERPRPRLRGFGRTGLARFSAGVDTSRPRPSEGGIRVQRPPQAPCRAEHLHWSRVGVVHGPRPAPEISPGHPDRGGRLGEDAAGGGAGVRARGRVPSRSRLRRARAPVRSRPDRTGCRAGPRSGREHQTSCSSKTRSATGRRSRTPTRCWPTSSNSSTAWRALLGSAGRRLPEANPEIPRDEPLVGYRPAR